MTQTVAKRKKSMPVSTIVQILALWQSKTGEEKDEILRKIAELENKT